MDSRDAEASRWGFHVFISDVPPRIQDIQSEASPPVLVYTLPD